MKIDEKDKVSILLDLLSERYNASHRMRERSLNFAIWILGFGVALVWLLLSGISLTVSQKLLLTVFVAIVSMLTILFLRPIEKGFNNNRKLMIDIEQALGCYEKDVYTDSKQLFPEEYADTERVASKFKKFRGFLDTHFVSIYIWTVAVASMIVLLIWLSPNQQSRQNETTSLRKNKNAKLVEINNSSYKRK